MAAAKRRAASTRMLSPGRYRTDGMDTNTPAAAVPRRSPRLG
jgi:hypothetical protein